MKINKRLNKFLFDDSGIENIFKNVGQVTVAATIFKVATMPTNNMLTMKLLLIVFSMLLFALSILYADHKLIIPLLKTNYGGNEKYSDMKAMGWRLMFLNTQFYIYLGIFTIYLIVMNYFFDFIIKTVLR